MSESLPEENEIAKLKQSTIQCNRCGSMKTGIFPNCTHTYGCSDCGLAFVIMPKDLKRYNQN